jgi:hypothetical protein
MKAVGAFASVAAILLVAGCAVPPPEGPSVLMLPGRGKSFDQFRQEDASCRQYASQMMGGVSQQQAANESAVGSAAIGTGLGAVTGALIGSAAGHAGTGAAIGAGSGLLLGSAVGMNNARASTMSLQQRYDMAYTQCMVAHGNLPPAPPPPPPPAVIYAPPPVVYAPPPLPPPPYYP